MKRLTNEEKIVILNKVRQITGEASFTVLELRERLAAEGFPKTSGLVEALVKCKNRFEELGGGSYKFIGTPVHLSDLTRVQAECKHNKAKLREKYVDVPFSTLGTFSAEALVEELRNRGFNVEASKIIKL